VNLASRIEGAARPGEILVSDATHHLISSHWECVEKEPLRVKGFDRLIPSFEVAGPIVESDASGVSAAGAGYSVSVDPGALVGEEREKARRSLREALELLEGEADADG
jgi:hypothetical protein